MNENPPHGQIVKTGEVHDVHSTAHKLCSRCNTQKSETDSGTWIMITCL